MNVTTYFWKRTEICAVKKRQIQWHVWHLFVPQFDYPIRWHFGAGFVVIWFHPLKIVSFSLLLLQLIENDGVLHYVVSVSSWWMNAILIYLSYFDFPCVWKLKVLVLVYTVTQWFFPIEQLPVGKPNQEKDNLISRTNRMGLVINYCLQFSVEECSSWGFCGFVSGII